MPDRLAQSERSMSLSREFGCLAAARGPGDSVVASLNSAHVVHRASLWGFCVGGSGSGAGAPGSP